MSEILKSVKELLNKAQGYGKEGAQGSNSGGPAEAVSHSVQGAPSATENKNETNAANSGTHPKSAGGSHDEGSRPEGGESFKDDAEKEENIETPKGSGGRAPVARPETIKHEGGGSGPDSPGTATGEEQKQKSSESDLEKSEDDEDENLETEEHEKKESDDDAEKSQDSGDIYLDIDEFTSEIVAKAVEQLDSKYNTFVEQSIQKSNESEYIEAGLAKSLAIALDRIEELENVIKSHENAIVNVANTMNTRKSLIKSSDNIKGINNPSLSKTTLSKSEISSRLLDMQMQGNQGVDTNMVLRFDAVGDTTILPENIKTKLGIE